MRFVVHGFAFAIPLWISGYVFKLDQNDNFMNIVLLTLACSFIADVFVPIRNRQ